MKIKQQLKETDLQRRLTFAQRFIRKPVSFSNQIITVDEAAFFMNDLVNKQIHRNLAPKNDPP